MALPIGDAIAAATMKRLSKSIAHSVDGLPQKANKAWFNIAHLDWFQTVQVAVHSAIRAGAPGHVRQMWLSIAWPTITSCIRRIGLTG